MKRLPLVILLVACATVSFSQTNLLIKPSKPQSGDVIQIEYTPAGDLANTMGKVEAVMYVYSVNGRVADDLPLTKSGKKYTAKIPTDTSSNFVQLGFYVGEKYDNNYNNGYYLHLYKGDKIKEGSFKSLSSFYQFGASDTRVDKDELKGLAAIQKEFELYPQSKRKFFFNYLGLVKATKGDVNAVVQEQIRNKLTEGLKTEDDYVFIEMLNNYIKLTEDAAKFKAERLEKFPNGRAAMNDYVQKYQATKDTVEKEVLYAVLETKIKTDPEWKDFAYIIDNHTIAAASKLAKRRDWQGYKNTLNSIAKKNMVAANYNSMAWSLQEKGQDLNIAAELSSWATQFAKKEITEPSGVKPQYFTAKQWAESRQQTFGTYADTYAMVLYKSGKTKEALPYAKEAALTISKGKDIDLNTTFALIAEKELPATEVKSELEKFVKEGHTSSAINNILKTIYTKENGNAENFEQYIGKLSEEANLKMIEELKKSMLKTPSPSVTLTDLKGDKVSINDLKGKVVIVDFWATWCGPCKASFPAMQKAVTKYSTDENVKFVFVNTWERVDNKEKNASDFITSNKYTFDVWMDKENQLVEKFKVDGIPTKFVIDKEGNIRFKSVGFNGSDEKLLSEISAMIEMASTEGL
jgi:thiol-disulfide isomerase/thioredoxin